MVLPENKTIFECVKDGSFKSDNIDFGTFMLNKHLFEIVGE